MRLKRDKVQRSDYEGDLRQSKYNDDESNQDDGLSSIQGSISDLRSSFATGLKARVAMRNNPKPTPPPRQKDTLEILVDELGDQKQEERKTEVTAHKSSLLETSDKKAYVVPYTPVQE